MGLGFGKCGWVAVMLLLFGSSQASGFAINMLARNATTSLAVGDTVTVDVFFDATDVGINVFSTSVLSSNANSIHYDAAASVALPASGAPVPVHSRPTSCTTRPSSAVCRSSRRSSCTRSRSRPGSPRLRRRRARRRS